MSVYRNTSIIQVITISITIQIDSFTQDIYIFIANYNQIGFILVRISVYRNTFIIQAITISRTIQICSFIQDIYIFIANYNQISFILIRISVYRITFIVQSNNNSNNKSKELIHSR